MGVIKIFEAYYGDRILASMAQRGDYTPLLKARSLEEARKIAIAEKPRRVQFRVVSDNIVQFPLV